MYFFILGFKSEFKAFSKNHQSPADIQPGTPVAWHFKVGGPRMLLVDKGIYSLYRYHYKMMLIDLI